MEQRPLRLGDILDDYCTRERRVTNHAVVAMIDDTVKQTRCTTCDAEHPYKGGQAPRRRKKETGAAAATLVEVETPPSAPLATADIPDDNLQHSDNEAGETPELVDEPVADEPVMAQASETTDNEYDEPEAEAAPMIASEGDDDVPQVEEGPVHRRLIRAQLPRIEGQKDERRPTDFTIRQTGGRNGNVATPFRGGNNGRMKARGAAGGGGGFNNGNGHRANGGQRFGGPRPGQGQGRGQGGGFRSAQPRPGGGGGRKRSR